MYSIIQYKYLNRVYFECKTKLCLTCPGRHGKYIFREEIPIYKVYSTISINRTHLFMKTQAHDESRAPPDKIRALHCLLPIEFHGLTSRIDFKGLSLFGS